jgi:hypothetical protein
MKSIIKKNGILFFKNNKQHYKLKGDCNVLYFNDTPYYKTNGERFI